MANVFLSDAWFDASEKIAESFGKIDLPEKLVGFILNLTVTGGPGGDKAIHFTEGRFGNGHHKNANTHADPSLRHSVTRRCCATIPRRR